MTDMQLQLIAKQNAEGGLLAANVRVLCSIVLLPIAALEFVDVCGKFALD